MFLLFTVGKSFTPKPDIWVFWNLTKNTVSILSNIVLCSKWTIVKIIMHFNNINNSNIRLLKKFKFILCIRAPSCGETVTLHQQRAARKYRLKKFLLSFLSVNPLVDEKRGTTKTLETWTFAKKKSSNGGNGRIKQAAIRKTEPDGWAPCSVWEKPVSSVPPSLWRRGSHTLSGTTRPPPGRRSVKHRRLKTVQVRERRTERERERRGERQLKKQSWSQLRRL